MPRQSKVAPTPIWLSIVIPAYNESERLPPTLQTIRDFLKRQGWAMKTEVIVVDDGSADETVAAVVRLVRNWPRLTNGRSGLSVITIPHAGKGAATRQGVLAALGEYCFLCDADLSMPIAELPKFLPPRAPKVDIIIGSREAPGARRFDEPPYRHLMGRVFNRLVQIMALPGIRDSQCGFKCFTRAAAQDLCELQQLPGFGFDVELLALARVRGHSILEMPIDWYHAHNSRVHPVRDTIAMVRDVWRVRAITRHITARASMITVPPVESSSAWRPTAQVLARHDTPQE